MTKPELIDAISKSAALEDKRLTKAQIKCFVDSFVDVVTETLANGEDVTIVGFGKFKVSERAARVGRNPKTGEPMQIDAVNSVRFSAGKGLKDAVKGVK